MTHFYRACPKHRDELVEKDEQIGHERLWCPQGHYVSSWMIISDEGGKIGKAWVDREEMLVGEPARDDQSPGHLCRHGHNDWAYQKSSQRWRCRTCNRLRSRIENARRRESA